MTTKIYAPDPRVSGESYVGPHVLVFRDGVAEYDGELSEGALTYMRSHGYGIDGAAAEPDTIQAEVPDPRDHDTPEVVGTPLRDAAVDPDPDVDFLAPVNAGQANPHGPEVVSPTIHASGVKAVVPGPVGTVGEDDKGAPVVEKDTDAQDQRESDFAEATLVEQTPVPEATADAAKVDVINEDQHAAEHGTFDPSEHTAAEVNDYLATADDAERDRVLAAEADGKARKSIGT